MFSVIYYHWTLNIFSKLLKLAQILPNITNNLYSINNFLLIINMKAFWIIRHCQPKICILVQNYLSPFLIVFLHYGQEESEELIKAEFIIQKSILFLNLNSYCRKRTGRFILYEKYYIWHFWAFWNLKSDCFLDSF